MRTALAFCGLLIVAALAGCVSDDPAAGSDDRLRPDDVEFNPFWYSDALVSDDGHDHTEFAHHQGLSTPNFQLLGWDPLTNRDGTSPGGSSCGDIANATAGRIGVVMSTDSTGIVIMDLTDPSAPAMVGEFYLTATGIYDAVVVPSSDFIVMVTEAPDPNGIGDPLGLMPTAPAGGFRSACGDAPVYWPMDRTADMAPQDPVPRPVSAILLDISDLAEPVIVDMKPIQGLGHGVFATHINGVPMALTITENIAQGSRFYTLFEIVEDEQLGPSLQYRSIYQADPSLEHIASVIGHSDGWLETHPVTGDLTGYFVAGTQMLLVDYSDPENPTTMSSWTDVPAQLAADHNLHSIYAEPTLRDGRHYVYLGPENGNIGETPTGVVWVIDATDPYDPQEVAAWTLPVEVDWSNGGAWSPHYLTVVGDTLFVSMYHGGVWALDISGVGIGSPSDIHLLPSIGVFIPANEPPAKPQGTGFATAPNLFEVFDFEDGTLATFDSNSGVYTFRFDEGDPAPAPTPWPIRGK